MFVTNFLPAQRADLDYVAACVSVIDVNTFEKVKDIQLANGSNALRGLCITPDGKYVYVSHNLGRFTVPTSQLQHGWMNSSAFSIIDAENLSYAGVVIVDEPDRGAAGIWSIACDEKQIYITHSGTHEVSVIDHEAMREKFEAYPDKSRLDYDLTFLYGLRTRIPLQGNGPRCMVTNENKVVIPTNIAGAMLSGILSDTLILKSPTTTKLDIEAVKELSSIASVDYQEYGIAMFKAGSSLEGIDKEDIIYQDFKNFNYNNDKIGVGQVFTTDVDYILNNKEEYVDLLNKISIDRKYKIVLLFITDIIKNGSYILYNDESQDIIKESYKLERIKEGHYLKDVVSRKKQMIPPILETLEKLS